MTERPIIFSAPMVRAILAGRKTQTRRVVKPQPEAFCSHVEPFRGEGGGWIAGDNTGRVFRCPYGAPGDRLWVRETWAPNEGAEGRVVYRADHSDATAGVYTADLRNGQWTTKVSRWRPSIFMPRWASRITLEVESVHVERLQAISEDDAQAEGVERPILEEGAIMHTLEDGMVLRGHPLTGEYRDAFRDLWDGLNAARGHGWDTNPWVWVVTFKVVPAVAA